MKFFGDENLERLVIEALRAIGHDVATIPEEAVGLLDRDVLGRSTDERRVLVTNDKDFAELAFLQRAATTGIIIRMPRSSSRDKARRVIEVIAAYGDRLETSRLVWRRKRAETAYASPLMSVVTTLPM